ncbi:thioesterase family protein [Pusillimonas sp. NJUB218]|uniref:acyl-CoA thioesterase n=1 Tax=Pusillimonas sp. NJUB218 TaxID=2023230 RepID=UPI000FF4297F|nr:acyl-CoA thioesterase [Pusillimonas sp. NJUB218]ROT43924.1 hypothetical protein CHR62_15205 [Pusillimonas sp. NJUB218]
MTTQNSTFMAVPGPREQIISTQPFVVRRRILWGECDPAGVVYTPRYGDLSADAGQLFLACIGGGKGYVDAKRKQGIGTPCKAFSLVFHSSLAPDDEVDISVTVGHIGNTSFELVIKARTPKEQLVFEGSTTLITIQQGTRAAIKVPTSLRDLLVAYQTA